MQKIKFLILFPAVAFMLVTISSCRFGPARNVARCFYYWKSVYETNNTDITDLRALEISRLYIKLFDVVWDRTYGGPVPVSEIEFKSMPPAEIEVVPVVFITVDALERLPVEQAGGLAGKIFKKINSILNRNRLGSVREIQLDCDWNNTTKAKYFTVLDRLRRLAGAQGTCVSATLRLHQVKYASQTGIPPADKGMLMFYNFDSPTSSSISNSILDLEVGKEYTSALGKYPLDLDLALPLFSWGVLFQDDRFQGLIGNLRAKDLADDPHFKKVNQWAGDNYLALADCSLKNIRISKNDRIRVEEIRFEELLASTRYLAGRIPSDGGQCLNVALFSFDCNLIQGVGGCEKIVRLYHSLH